MRRVSLFFLCFISAFSLLSPQFSLGYFSFFAPELLGNVKFFDELKLPFALGVQFV
jgi:hypothetical protein